MSKAISALLDATGLSAFDDLERFGVEIGKLYTNHGLPVDMALSRLDGLSQNEKLAVIDGIAGWLVEHKRNSGATEQAIDRQRKANRDMIEHYINTGEISSLGLQYKSNGKIPQALDEASNACIDKL